MGGLVSTLVLSLAILRTPGISPELGGSRCGPPPHDLSHLLLDPGRRVRALTPRLAEALESGARRSSTFQQLLSTLQQRDVIVQFLEEPDLRPPTAAQLMIVPVPGEVRFVRVQVANRRDGDDLVALLGHELVHAIEIAREPQVRDAKTLKALYTRIGFGLERLLQYDTTEANVVERRIRRELEEERDCVLLAKAR